VRKEIIRICQDCNKEDTLEYRANRKPSPFCRSCQGRGERNHNWKGGLTQTKWKHSKVIKTCPWCGIAFITSKSYKKYCSTRCRKQRYDRLYHKQFRHARRAKEKNAQGNFTISEFYNLIKKLNNFCPSCGNRFPTKQFTIDHIVPLAHGGTNYISNIQPLCTICNVRKNAKTINYLTINSQRHERQANLNGLPTQLMRA